MVENLGVDNARKLAWELDEEEKELWMQLRRKRDFESRVAEKRAQLEDLRERRRKVSVQHAEVAASVEHLSSEVAFAHEQVKEVEHDIAVLTESNRIVQQTFAQQHIGAMQHGGHGGVDPSAILAEEKNRQESIQLQHEQIAHLRAHLNKLRAEKSDLLRRQQFLFEKQRSAEQDRNRLLGTLQDDRSHINEVRLERIRLWEDRSRMEREMAQIVHEAHQNTSGANGMRPRDPQVPGTDGGVRGHITRDTPEVFSVPAGRQEEARGSSPHSSWTGFGGDQTSTSVYGMQGGGGGGYPGSISSSAPTFGGPPGGGGGITEWADKLRDFRASAPNRGGGGF